jgi:hypothetical protein
MRKKFKVPPQIVRLLLLLVGIVSSYCIARAFLTPRTFGQYGWFRGVALDELRVNPVVFAGKKACEECHSDQVAKVAKFAHKNISCEACHGPRQEHAQDPDVKMEVKSFSHCLRCHEANPSRPKTHKQIVSKDHYTGSKCLECHLPHAPSEVP